MNIITLFPFEGILLFDKYIPFNATWQVVQILLGIPEHRYLDFDINDMDDIVGDAGNYINDFNSRIPTKSDFFEERNGVKFVYRNNNLCCIEPDCSYSVVSKNFKFSGNGVDECDRCKNKHNVIVYAKQQKFAVKDLGLIGRYCISCGLYKQYSKEEFDNTMKIIKFINNITK